MTTLIDELAHDRHAARYPTVRGRRHAPIGRTAASPLAGPRSRAGWLLVGVGLRLALPGHQAAARRARLLGQ